MALGATAALGLLLARTRARLARIERRAQAIEARLQDELARDVAAARGEARDASAAARRAARAAGIEDPPPRLPFEPVTGRVVRAVAIGAGARRALARATTPGWSRRGLRRSA